MLLALRVNSIVGAGNYYINDKSMGSGVGQQPFGGLGLQVGGSQWVGLQVGGSQWVGL